ncbi:MAG: hypothetical protein KDD67_05310 [Ignavibacteriae bacterium]|nr:hypothetical protein [Ignavibacteriota bacterium]MCB9216256.1 hypothetical protein [Ignavibacteria bacterium]
MLCFTGLILKNAQFIVKVFLLIVYKYQNLNVFDFEIDSDDMARLNQLNQNQAIAWAANGLNPMEVAPPLKQV